MDEILEPLLSQLSHDLAGILQENRGIGRLKNLGLRRSGRLPVAAALRGLRNGPILFVTDRADHALTLMDELALWLPGSNRLIFPEPSPLFYENAAWGESTRQDRLLVLTTLASYHIPGANTPSEPPIIVAPARAVMTRTIPRHEFLKATRTIKTGQSLRIDDLARTWLSIGYESVTTVIAPGQFARRGGILDLWSPAERFPVRIEFFGDEIETMRPFDPATQRTLPKNTNEKGSQQRLLISPAREYLLSNTSKPAPAESPAPIMVEPKVEDVSEFSIPLLHSQLACILDYLPPQATILVEDYQLLEDTIAEVEEQAVKLRQDYLEQQIIPQDFPPPYLSWSELQDILLRREVIALGPYQGDNEQALKSVALERSFTDRFLPGTRFGGRLKPTMDYLLDRRLEGDRIFVVSRQSARLKEVWTEQYRAQAEPASSEAPQPIFIEGSLGEGWIYQPLVSPPIDLLTDGEIFGWRRPKPRYRRSERYAIAREDPEASYSDLQIGDFIVHIDHGIGRFTGLVTRTVDNLEHEYLRIEYADNAQLFVPVHQVDRLMRYVGSENRPPVLSRLGSSEWKNVKSHVKEAVKEVAEDLLSLYARRNVIEGYQFSQDTVWQQELEASFPYIETEDQIRVLAEVKRDMESTRPMDRLICGDVGYGKTEVALRAAFKAVSEGKQVAILVPTTVLAQQHYHTFLERLAAFPVEVEMLSRFRTPQQQRDIIDRLALGKIDILIGTHRLLSTDVKFKDLGLLIIDEEQRFGVTHKEALKRMRTEVDVLTLTATPIPRTLYMALSGVRDISTINTPPEERLPIITHVGPYSPGLVRQAVMRELERGGQVFFVHNRIQTIGAMHNHLVKVIPEARIAIAHGQMAENVLSERMDQFTSGEVDILLSTSIIESGLDIPNANTLIVDRADTFGLAQLYQLRGRVGRGAQRAYAYFFRHKRRPPTDEGRQRLETIAENTQLGAGFSIAMRDLEIRGAGDILGTRQHGHIAAVGFYLYTRLLAEAVRRLRVERGLPQTTDLDTLQVQLPSLNIELPLPASIPADYVPDRQVRLNLYRRIVNLRASLEIEALIEELNDRFGTPPETVFNLLFQVRIRHQAEKAGLNSISGEANQIAIRYPDGKVPEVLPNLGQFARIGKTAVWFSYQQTPSWQQELVKILDVLVEYSQNHHGALSKVSIFDDTVS